MEEIQRRICELQLDPLNFSNFAELKALRLEYAQLLTAEQEAGIKEIGG